MALLAPLATPMWGTEVWTNVAFHFFAKHLLDDM